MEITVQITARELIEKGLWVEACELIGVNEYAVNEGMMESDEKLTLTEEQARQLGLLPCN